jgi:hypothetical protein
LQVISLKTLTGNVHSANSEVERKSREWFCAIGSNAPPVGFATVMQFLSLKIESLLAIIEAELNLANPTPPRVLCYAKIILLKSAGEHWSMP